MSTPRNSTPRAATVRERTIQFSETGGDFVVGRLVGWHIADDVIVDRRIDTARVGPLGRLASPRYSIVSDMTP